MVPGDLRYSKEHEWVRINDDSAEIGITDYAQEELGDITFVELPEVGSKVKEEEVFATIESVKAASDIYAPISGTVAECNNSLNDSPELINESPYEKGWICRVIMSDPGEMDRLMNAPEYSAYIEGLAE